MKIIDLLNKIANGEEIKAKLKFKLGDIIINYYGMNNYFRTPEYDIAYIDKGCTTHDFTLGTLIKSLNDEVEIIEEKKIPKKIDIWYEPIKDTELERHDTDTSIEILANMCDDLKDKYNEIIDYLQSKGDK